jgi:hypothetical protein
MEAFARTIRATSGISGPGSRSHRVLSVLRYEYSYRPDFGSSRDRAGTDGGAPGPTGAQEQEAAVVQVLQRRRAEAARPTAPRPRTSWRQDLVTTLLAFWMVVGTASDSWAHLHQKPDTFFTPWHGIVYTGYVALAAWMVWLARPTAAGARLVDRIPVGYGLGLVGALIMVPGSVGDGFWHTLLGIEVNLEAELSPTHLALLIGVLLMFTSPARAGWRTTTPAYRPTFVAFLPQLLSLTATTAILAVFFGNLSPFEYATAAMGPSGADPIGSPGFYFTEQGFMDVVVTTLLLLTPLLLAARRWRLPFGTATVLLTVPPAFCLAASWGQSDAWLLLAPLAAGLVADWLGSRARPADDRRGHLLVATVTPLALWSVYFVVLHLRRGLDWSPEMWTGSIVVAVMVGYALHLLVVQPRTPSPEPEPAEGAAQP